MPIIDLGRLLAPVSEGAPCGENLEYDADFGALERAAQWTPERVMGNETKPAEEPDWNDVLEKAAALFDRTKDLRVGVHLLHAGLRVGGLPLFAAGMAVLRGLLNDYWDTVHPQLDRDDNDDPTLRMNTLLALNDRTGLIGSLSRTPLVRSRALGRVTLRDVRIASGELKPPEEGSAALEQAHIDAAFLDGELADLQANAEAARNALEDLTALGAHLSDRVGSQAPDLTALTAELRAIHSVLAAQLGRRGAASGETAVGAEGGNGAAGAQGIAVGEIKSRDDVVRVLDRVCEYFQRNEPSSPVPLLLRRAQRLVAKDFMDILRDLTPDAVSQAKLIGGLDQEE